MIGNFVVTCSLLGISWMNELICFLFYIEKIGWIAINFVLCFKIRF